MILHLASKCQYLQTHYSSSVCMLPFTWDVFVGKYEKLWSIWWTFVNSINLYLLWVKFIAILTKAFQHPPLFLFTSVRSILHAQFGTFRSALYNVMLSKRAINTQILHANILWILLRFYYSLFISYGIKCNIGVILLVQIGFRRIGNISAI